jgi:hypothetical protein
MRNNISAILFKLYTFLFKIIREFFKFAIYLNNESIHLLNKFENLIKNLIKKIGKLNKEEGIILDSQKESLGVSSIITSYNYKRNFNNIIKDCVDHLHHNNIFSGKMLEIGGSVGSNVQKEFIFLEYHNFDINNNPIIPTIIGDITKYNKSISDGSYDFIYSRFTLEHVENPWLAAIEISRIVKRGGLICIIVPWSWRFHPVPNDYWRFSPEGLKILFKEFQCVDSYFDISHRRNDDRGIYKNKSDYVPCDYLGGWRETWASVFIGFKK